MELHTYRLRPPLLFKGAARAGDLELIFPPYRRIDLETMGSGVGSMFWSGGCAFVLFVG